MPAVRRVVLVGNKISPGNPVKKADGTMMRTLWGEMAWQLASPQVEKEAKKAFSASQPTTRRRRVLATCCVNCSKSTGHA